MNNVKNARWHKVNTHILFPEYDYSLWLDSNIIVNNDNLFKVFDNLIKQKALIGVPNHTERKCIYDEAEIIKNNNIDYKNIVDSEICFLKSQNYPKNNGLCETGIMFRQHNLHWLFLVFRFIWLILFHQAFHRHGRAKFYLLYPW